MIKSFQNLKIKRVFDKNKYTICGRGNLWN